MKGFRIKLYNFFLIIFLCFTTIVIISCKDNGIGPVLKVTPKFIGMDGKLVTKLVYQKPYLYAGAAAKGLWRLDLDKMTDWEYLGLADTNLGNWANVGVCDLDIFESEILVAYNNDTVGIWHTTDEGGDWFRSDDGIQETNDTTVKATSFQNCRRSPDNINIAIAIHATATFRSIDGGYHWSLIAGRRGLIGGDDHVRWNPFQPGEFWVWGTSSVFQPYLGAVKDYGLNGKVAVDFLKLGFSTDQIVSDVAFDCGDPNIIHVATSQGLITSTDGGYNCVIGKATIPDSAYFYLMIEHHFKSGLLFLAGGNSIYYSIDHGETIHLLSEVPVQFIESFAIDESGQRLFVGSVQGVYSIPFSLVVH